MWQPSDVCRVLCLGIHELVDLTPNYRVLNELAVASVA